MGNRFDAADLFGACCLCGLIIGLIVCAITRSLTNLAWEQELVARHHAVYRVDPALKLVRWEWWETSKVEASPEKGR